MTEEISRYIYRMTAGDMTTIEGAPYGPPARKMKAIDWLEESVKLTPSATLIRPLPEEGIPDVWEVRISGDKNDLVYKLRTGNLEVFRTNIPSRLR